VNTAVGVYARPVRGLAIAFGACFAVGCGGATPAPGPGRTVSALAEALRAGDPPAIARLTGRTEAEVQAAQQTQRDELHALGETLARATVDEAAHVYLVDGPAVTLVREGESWRVDRGVLGRPSMGRPLDAVLALHDALVRSRIDGVLGLLARGTRAEAQAELSRWILGTADPDALQITVTGESATVTTPTGDHLDLVRESGQWRIVELR
jgi:hypothetical protein